MLFSSCDNILKALQTTASELLNPRQPTVTSMKTICPILVATSFGTFLRHFVVYAFLPFSAPIWRFRHYIYPFRHRRQILYQILFNDVFYQELCLPVLIGTSFVCFSTKYFNSLNALDLKYHEDHEHFIYLISLENYFPKLASVLIGMKYTKVSLDVEKFI